MSYDHDLAHRIRELLSGAQFTERAMFGGLAFLIGGNMAVCVSGRGGLMVRVPAQDTAALLDRSHVEPMVMGGREVRGWIRVTDQGIGTKRQLQPWVRRGVDHARSLPAK
ncbi:MAG: TfoX/Sxy family protein [Mycobacterium sp.]